MRISAVTSTMLFRGTAARPRQIVQVTVAERRPGRVTVAITGAGVSTPDRLGSPETDAGAGPPPPAAGEQVAEVGIEVAAPGPARQHALGDRDRGRRAPAAGPSRPAEVTIAEPGWTMWMVSHFHYDPVWWSTQGQFLQSRLLLPGDDGRLPEVRTAFELVTLHLDAARRDPDYKFVLAEIDYLKPHFDAHPEDRADLLDVHRARAGSSWSAAATTSRTPT